MENKTTFTKHRCTNPITDKFEEIYIVEDPFGRVDYITLFADGHYYTRTQITEYSLKRIEEHRLSKLNGTTNPET